MITLITEIKEENGLVSHKLRFEMENETKLEYERTREITKSIKEGLRLLVDKKQKEI